MLRCRTLQVDNADPRGRLQRGREIVEEGIGLGDLVIHVHEHRRIQRRRRKARIVWFAEREYQVCQLQKVAAFGKLDEVVPSDVLGDNRAGAADQTREADSVVATARTNVADRHTRFQLKTSRDLTSLIQGVAVLLARAAWTDDLCNRAFG